MSNVLVNSLPQYVEQNGDKLLKKAILGAETAQRFTLQTGVKTQTALNLLNTDVQFQDGKSCGFNAAGSQTISQRTITAGVIKVDMEWCDRVLLDSCAQHQVRIAAGQRTMPFEEQFVSDIIDNINLKVDKLIWQGDTTKTTDANLKWCDGMIKHLNANDGITVASQKLEHDAITKSNVCGIVDDVVLAIPTEVLNDSTIYMGYDVFRLWRMALAGANLYHESGDGLDRTRAYYPGTNIEVKPVAGLNEVSTIVSIQDTNAYYGTDMMNDAEKFMLWFSADNDMWRFKSSFAVGTQVAFPNQCVISNLGD